MKTRDELEPLIAEIASDQSPVGMDAVYVHALILDKLDQMQTRLETMEQRLTAIESRTKTES